LKTLIAEKPGNAAASQYSKISEHLPSSKLKLI